VNYESFFVTDMRNLLSAKFVLLNFFSMKLSWLSPKDWTMEESCKL